MNETTKFVKIVLTTILAIASVNQIFGQIQPGGVILQEISEVEAGEFSAVAGYRLLTYSGDNGPGGSSEFTALSGSNSSESDFVWTPGTEQILNFSFQTNANFAVQSGSYEASTLALEDHNSVLIRAGVSAAIPGSGLTVGVRLSLDGSPAEDLAQFDLSWDGQNKAFFLVTGLPMHATSPVSYRLEYNVLVESGQEFPDFFLDVLGVQAEPLPSDSPTVGEIDENSTFSLVANSRFGFFTRAGDGLEDLWEFRVESGENSAEVRDFVWTPGSEQTISFNYKSTTSEIGVGSGGQTATTTTVANDFDALVIRVFVDNVAEGVELSVTDVRIDGETVVGFVEKTLVWNGYNETYLLVENLPTGEDDLVLSFELALDILLDPNLIVVGDDFQVEIFGVKYVGDEPVYGPLEDNFEKVVEDSMVSILWQTENGASYTLETTTDLVAGLWRTIPGSLTIGDGNPASFDVLEFVRGQPLGDPWRFWRVRKALPLSLSGPPAP